MFGPISGYQKGKLNQTVLRDRGFAENLIKFKYPDYAIDDGKTSFVIYIYHDLILLQKHCEKLATWK